MTSKKRKKNLKSFVNVTFLYFIKKSKNDVTIKKLCYYLVIIIIIVVVVFLESAPQRLRTRSPNVGADTSPSLRLQWTTKKM